MALLSAKPKSKRIPISLRFDDHLISDIKAYNAWAGINRLDDFLEQAARFVLGRDKDWQKKINKPSPENNGSV
jgi:hypothetical protein